MSVTPFKRDFFARWATSGVRPLDCVRRRAAAKFLLVLEQVTVGFHFVGKSPMVKTVAFVSGLETSFDGDIDDFLHGHGG
jgi:hypothetical protein